MFIQKVKIKMKLSATAFIALCVLAAAGKSHSETSRISNILKVLSIAQTCVPWHNLKTDPTCPANETCVEVVGKPSTYECAKSVSLRSLGCTFVWLFVVHSPVACSFVNLACTRLFFFMC